MEEHILIKNSTSSVRDVIEKHLSLCNDFDVDAKPDLIEMINSWVEKNNTHKCLVTCECSNSKPVVFTVSGNGTSYYVKCPVCQMCGPHGVTRSDAVRIWNSLMYEIDKGRIT